MKGNICRVISTTVLVCILLVARVCWAEESRQAQEMPAIADKEFLSAVRDAIQDNKKLWLAEHIVYPLYTVFIDGKNTRIRSREQFLQNYDAIINEHVRSAVGAQDVGAVVKNWRGLMVGRGALWIEVLNSGRDGAPQYLISAINNVPAGRHKNGLTPQLIDVGLNDVYKRLLAETSLERQARLRGAQQAWVVYRDRQCAFETIGLAGSQFYDTAVLACYADLSDMQSARLQSHLE